MKLVLLLFLVGFTASIFAAPLQNDDEDVWPPGNNLEFDTWDNGAVDDDFWTRLAIHAVKSAVKGLAGALVKKPRRKGANPPKKTKKDFIPDFETWDRSDRLKGKVAKFFQRIGDEGKYDEKNRFSN